MKINIDQAVMNLSMPSAEICERFEEIFEITGGEVCAAGINSEIAGRSFITLACDWPKGQRDIGSNDQIKEVLKLCSPGSWIRIHIKGVNGSVLYRAA